MANYKLIIGQTVPLGVAGVDGAGNLIPAVPLPAIPVWTTSDATKTQLTPSPDGSVCNVKGIALGTGITITVTCASESLSQTFVLDVVTAAPVSLVINPAAPVQNPGGVDVRQLSAGGRYLGLCFNSPPNDG